MLQAIREKAQGWIAWAIVILISIPFALWGIQEYLGVGSEPEVAMVDGEPITQRMLDQRTRDFRENLRLSLGDAYRPDLFDDRTLKQQVLESMIEEMVLVKSASDWNLRTSDVQARGFIASIPAFQRDGRFDQQAYETAVRNRGMSRAGFEQNVRQDLVLGQLRSGVRESVFVTRSDLAERVRLQDERRTLSYARIPAASFRDQITATGDELQSFYQANIERYRTPEQVKLAYVLLDATSLGGLVEVDEAGLEQYFADHRGEFVAPEERAMRHILISVAKGADAQTEQAAQEEAAGLLERIRGGEDFAALAKEFSDDPGSAGNGGDLGWVEPGLMVPAFEETAFALEQNQVSEPVRTEFGFHIIQVTGIRGGSEAGFAELRDQVEDAMRKFEGENLYFDYAERLANAAYESPDSLTPAAESLGLEVINTDWVTREQVLPGALASPRVINAAFSDDVLIERNNSELIEVGQQQALVVRVAEHQPAGVQALDDIRARVEQDYLDAKASELAAAAGAEALAGLTADGGSLGSLAAEKDWPLQSVDAAGRHQAEVPAEVLARAFSLAPPAQAGAAHTGVVSAEGDYMLIEVGSVQGGELAAMDEARQREIAEQAAVQAATAQLDYVMRSLRERADVDLRPLDQ